VTLATLSAVLQPALRDRYAVAGVVCLGWEDMRAYVRAAEAEDCAVILQAGPGCRAHTPLPVLAASIRVLAEAASVPVVAHLDHGYTVEECRQALEEGFTSLMYDGSRKPLAQNIDETGAVAALAHRYGLSCEGEVGFVGYADGETSQGTDPEEAATFAKATGVDALAISVGNVHLQQDAGNGLDRDRIAAIEAVTDVPLVIHGGSGVPAPERRKLAQTTSICKFNIGTELRMAFGAALRAHLAQEPDHFDRIDILKGTESALMETARVVLRTLKT